MEPAEAAQQVRQMLRPQPHEAGEGGGDLPVGGLGHTEPVAGARDNLPEELTAGACPDTPPLAESAGEYSCRVTRQACSQGLEQGFFDNPPA